MDSCANKTEYVQKLDFLNQTVEIRAHLLVLSYVEPRKYATLRALGGGCCA